MGLFNRDYKETVQDLLEHADVQIDGNRPWDIQVHNDDLYKRILTEGALGVGESYMEGWWDSQAIDQLIDRTQRANLSQHIKLGTKWSVFGAVITNPQSIAKAFRVGKEHYDNGNDLYEAMLDPRMVYTCGYWKNVDNLADAQENKLELVCQKLELQQGMKVLDIGCGWGSFLKYAVEHYDVEGVGITISQEQVNLINDEMVDLPIEVRFQDYRDLGGEKFDRVASLGMFEHVGPKNYKTYMQAVNRSLKEDGLFLLHTIGKLTPTPSNRWIRKYIFPGGHIPTIGQISNAADPHFVMEDWHNFGQDYDATLMAWNDNFQKAWPKLKAKYGNKWNGKFKRGWEYYLLACAGDFRSRRDLQLWQTVFSKNGFTRRYESVR